MKSPIASALFLPLLLALPACGSEAPQPVPTPTASEPGEPQIEKRERGPLTFSYDPAMLSAVEIELALPPAYDETVQAAKLIAADRAARLGQEMCSYGESGMPEICDPAMEAGLAFAVLPESADIYREALLAGGIPEAEIKTARIGKYEGFRFTAQAEGSGASYTFLPAGEETVLVQRQFRGGEGRGTEAYGSVLESVTIAVQPDDAEPPVDAGED